MFGPLREIEIIGSDDLAAGERYAEVIQRLGTQLTHTHRFITLEHVERLVVAVNYPLALQRYQAQAEVFEADFLQAADAAEAFAFVTERGVVAVVRAALLDTLGETENTRAASSRIVTHELCHGHDLGRRHPWLWQAATSRHFTSVNEATLHWLCHFLWSEYFANRYSYFCNPSLADDWVRLELLFDRLPGMEPSHAGKAIAMAFGYALGSLAAEGASLQDLRPDLTRRLRACGLWAAWFEAGSVTAQLAQTGECWQHPGGLLRLKTAATLIVSVCRYGLR